MNTIVKEVPQTFDHHILLYAKNWYKRSGDILKDLKILLEEYTGNLMSDSDVRECLCNCYSQYAPMFDRGRDLQAMLKWGWYFQMCNRTPEEIMIGSLSIAEGKYVDPTQLLPVLVKEKETA